VMRDNSFAALVAIAILSASASASAPSPSRSRDASIINGAFPRRRCIMSDDYEGEREPRTLSGEGGRPTRPIRSARDFAAVVASFAVKSSSCQSAERTADAAFDAIPDASARCS